MTTIASSLSALDQMPRCTWDDEPFGIEIFQPEFAGEIEQRVREPVVVGAIAGEDSALGHDSIVEPEHRNELAVQQLLGCG